VLLYVFSPWIIAVSRNVREYAVVPLFFYLDCSGIVIYWIGWIKLEELLAKAFYRIAMQG